MIAATDTSPLNDLIQIEEVHVLPGLFEHVLTASAVFKELQHDKTPYKVRTWIKNRPGWLELYSVVSTPSLGISFLRPGEREAIQTSLEKGSSRLLIDELAGRRAAQALQIETIGTLAILERGARAGLTNFRSALRKLEQTKFRMSPALKASFLARNP